MCDGYCDGTCIDCLDDHYRDLEDRALDLESLAQSLKGEPTTLVLDEWAEVGIDLAEIDLEEFRLWVESHEAAYADVDRLAEVA